MRLQEYKKDFTFELHEPIKYQDENSEKETKMLVLYAPSNKLAAPKAKLRQKILTAFYEMSKGSDKTESTQSTKEKNKLEPEALLFAIALSEDGIEIKETFKDLLKDGCLSLDGKFNDITSWHLDQIEDDEFEEMMGEYIINFIIPSWMKRLLAK